MRLDSIERVLYFAYGHNTQSETMYTRCPSAVLIGVGVLHNFRFVLKTFSDIEYDEKSVVYGVVWDISKNYLDTLDSDEDLHKHYDRIKVDIHCNDSVVKAQTFFMDPDYPAAKPTTDKYIKFLISGYKEHGLPLKQIKDAIERNIK